MEHILTFKNSDGSTAFQIMDGGSININGKEHRVSYVNKDFFVLNIKCWSFEKFYEEYVEQGAVVTPGDGLLVKAEYGKNCVDYRNAVFSYVWIPELGRSALYHDLRVIRETMPLGYYRADVRCSEGSCTIEPSVLCDHMASLLFPVDIFAGTDEKCLEVGLDCNYNMTKWNFECEQLAQKLNVPVSEVLAESCKESQWLVMMKEHAIAYTPKTANA